jgi:hypothetical protein
MKEIQGSRDTRPTVGHSRAPQGRVGVRRRVSPLRRRGLEPSAVLPALPLCPGPSMAAPGLDK